MNIPRRLPNMPEEIITEILYRLPVNSLVRFRCVCKYWKHLTTSDDNFIRSHLQHHPGRAGTVILYSYRDVFDFDVRQLTAIQNESIRIADGVKNRFRFAMNSYFNKFLNTPMNFWFNFGLTGSANGVLCISTFHLHGNCTRVFLWNPAINQFRDLPFGYYGNPILNYAGLVIGFYFCPITDDYKVVKILYEYEHSADGSLKYEIFSARAHDWKSVRSNRYVSPDRILYGDKIALCYNGSLHWTITDSASALWLNIFSAEEENFLESLLPFGEISNCFAKTHTLFMFKGCISIVGLSSLIASECEIWVMNQYGVDSSWTKQRVALRGFDIINLSSGPILITAGGKLLGRKEGCFVLYDLGSQRVEECMRNTVHSLAEVDGLFAVDYEESLVPIIPPGYKFD